MTPLAPAPSSDQDASAMDIVDELNHRLGLRRVLLARSPRPNDAAELAVNALERAALAAAVATQASGSETRIDVPDAASVEAALLLALAEGCAAAAASVLSADAVDIPEYDVVLSWPDATERRVPPGAEPLSPMTWLRGLAAALILRDMEVLAVLVHPDHLDRLQAPSELMDEFWPLLCRTTATVACGVALPPRTLDTLAAQLAPASVRMAHPEVVRTELMPLLAILGALDTGQPADSAIQRALELYALSPVHARSPDHAFRGCALEVAGLASLARDRGLATRSFPELPAVVEVGTPGGPKVAIAVKYWQRQAYRGEDPTGFLDLRGFPRSGRDQDVVSRNGRLVARYTARGRDGVPLAHAEFLLPGGPPSEPALPPALDAGERILLAEQYARESGAASAAGDVRLAANWMTFAKELIDVVMDGIPPGTDRLGAEAFVNPRGIAVFASEPGRFRRDRLQAFRTALTAPAPPIESRSTGSVVQPPVSPVSPVSPVVATGNAVESSMRSIEVIRTTLRPLLERLGVDGSHEALDLLRPRPEDFSRVFVGDSVEAARTYYEAAWSAELKIEAPAGSVLDTAIAVVPAGFFGSEPPSPLASAFPAAYQSIARWLNPHRIWVAWKYVIPGRESGISYDGLVWCDDRWIWFPKPYRALRRMS